MNADELLNQEFIQPATTDENYAEKREKVLSIVASGKSKVYFNLDLSIEQTQNLSPPDILNLHQKYVNLLGAQIVKSIGGSIIHLYTKIVSKVFDLDSEIELFDELRRDPVIFKSLEDFSRIIYFKFGSLLAPLSFGLITFQHINFESIKNGALARYEYGSNEDDGTTENASGGEED